MKIRRGLRRPPTNESHTTTNQKHAGTMKGGKEGSCNRQKSHNNQPKARWCDKGGEGGELQPARGARGKRESIVWGQSSWVVCVDLLTGGESLCHDGVSTHRPVLSPHLEAALNKIKFLVT
jgi:hypothetical protein